ncbi:MAG: hypothetical protein K2X82_00490 [Gemmataceae bacterium]|nr:hypothetical protein [Gemmataceae bacterium]
MPVLPRRVGPVLALAALAAAGCSDAPGVHSYRTPKSTEPRGPGPAAPGPTAGDYRILGAVYPADQPVWFFKLTGPADQLARHEADFDKLAASVRLQGDAVPAFDLPPGWMLTGPRSVSRGGVTVTFDQTVKLGPPDAPLELTISKSGGGIAQNVSRWAGQVGQQVGPADLDKVTRPFDAAGVKGVRVDVRGPQNPSGGMGGPMMGGKR